LGSSQRTKGAAYEREVLAVINEHFGTKHKRHIGQARDGGEDAVVGPLVLEMKRRKTLTTVGRWYAQAVAAARKYRRYPVVVMREDHGESMVLVSLTHFLDMLRNDIIDHIVDSSPVSPDDLDGLI
jgi:hypothetical protein